MVIAAHYLPLRYRRGPQPNQRLRAEKGHIAPGQAQAGHSRRSR
jgi:hypothetical protein